MHFMVDEGFRLPHSEMKPFRTWVSSCSLASGFYLAHVLIMSNLHTFHTFCFAQNRPLEM